MNDNVTKLPSKSKVSFAVYVPGERMPTFIEAENYVIAEGHILCLTKGSHPFGSTTVAAFHSWDYFERFEEAAVA